MTPEQFDRWKDFAMRMAKVCWNNRQRPSRDWIIEAVNDFFNCIGDLEIVAMRDWDGSDPYPEGHPYRRFTHTRDCGCRYPNGYMNPVPLPDRDCKWCGGTGTVKEYATPYGVGGRFSKWIWEYASAQRMMNASQRRKYDRLYESGQFDEADAFEDEFFERWRGPVACCIRAGLDCASAPSAGVVGFTAGHLRRMYPEGVPEWVFPPDERLKYWLSDEMNGTFRELPDSAGVVL